MQVNLPHPLNCLLGSRESFCGHVKRILTPMLFWSDVSSTIKVPGNFTPCSPQNQRQRIECSEDDVFSRKKLSSKFARNLACRSSFVSTLCLTCSTSIRNCNLGSNV